MAIQNIRTVFNHYCEEPRVSAVSQSPLYGVYSMGCNLLAHVSLLIACVPLLGVRRLPVPLDHFPVVGFYQQQWLDELEYIDAPHQRVSFAAARVIDGIRILGSYNPLTMALTKSRRCDCQCKCDCE